MVVFYLLWAEGRIRPPFPCVLNVATKMVSRWQRDYAGSCVTSRHDAAGWILGLIYSRLKRPECWPKTLPPFSNFSCPIYTQPGLHMVLTCCRLVCTIPLKFFHTPPLLPPLSSGAIIIIIKKVVAMPNNMLSKYQPQREHEHTPDQPAPWAAPHWTRTGKTIPGPGQLPPLGSNT